MRGTVVVGGGGDEIGGHSSSIWGLSLLSQNEREKLLENS